MARGVSLGAFEHVVLLALMHLDRDGYGMLVRSEIRRRTGRDVSIGAVYATLDRLEDKGMVRSETGSPSPHRGGRARRTFTITAGGARAVREARAELARMSEGLFPGAQGT